MSSEALAKLRELREHTEGIIALSMTSMSGKADFRRKARLMLEILDALPTEAPTLPMAARRLAHLTREFIGLVKTRPEPEFEEKVKEAATLVFDLTEGNAQPALSREQAERMAESLCSRNLMNWQDRQRAIAAILAAAQSENSNA